VWSLWGKTFRLFDVQLHWFEYLYNSICYIILIFFSLNVVIKCNWYLYITTCWCMEYTIVCKCVERTFVSWNNLFPIHKIRHLNIRQKSFLYNEWKFERRKWNLISSYDRGKSPRFSDYNQIEKKLTISPILFIT
jgi:hypothetical protein